jgi:hypothetical protein
VTHSLEGRLISEGCYRDFRRLHFLPAIVVGVFVGPFRGPASEPTQVDGRTRKPTSATRTCSVIIPAQGCRGG